MKDDVDEALEWLRFHKEKDSNNAARNKALKDKGEEYEIIEEDPEPDDPDVEANAARGAPLCLPATPLSPLVRSQVYVCEPPLLRGF